MTIRPKMLTDARFILTSQLQHHVKTLIETYFVSLGALVVWMGLWHALAMANSGMQMVTTIGILVTGAVVGWHYAARKEFHTEAGVIFAGAILASITAVGVGLGIGISPLADLGKASVVRIGFFSCVFAAVTAAGASFGLDRRL